MVSYIVGRPSRFTRHVLVWTTSTLNMLHRHLFPMLYVGVRPTTLNMIVCCYCKVNLTGTGCRLSITHLSVIPNQVMVDWIHKVLQLGHLFRNWAALVLLQCGQVFLWIQTSWVLILVNPYRRLCRNYVVDLLCPFNLNCYSFIILHLRSFINYTALPILKKIIYI